MQPVFQTQLNASVAVLQSLAQQADLIEAIAARVYETVAQGRLLLTCGNGGSATDAQHLAEELIGRYRSNRRALPAIALTADSSALLCFSTSGNSPNILAALRAARERGLGTIALLGKDGGRARELADLALVVPVADTARIQEAHLQVLHYICEVVEVAIARTEN